MHEDSNCDLNIRNVLTTLRHMWVHFSFMALQNTSQIFFFLSDATLLQYNKRHLLECISILCVPK